MMSVMGVVSAVSVNLCEKDTSWNCISSGATGTVDYVTEEECVTLVVNFEGLDSSKKYEIGFNSYDTTELTYSVLPTMCTNPNGPEPPFTVAWGCGNWYGESFWNFDMDASPEGDGSYSETYVICDFPDGNYPTKFLVKENGEPATGAEAYPAILMEMEELNFDILGTAPEVSDIQHAPEYPTCSDNVEICADVTDVSDIESVKLVWDNHDGKSGSWEMNKDGNEYCLTLSSYTLEADDRMTVVYDIYVEDEHANFNTVTGGSFTFDCEAPTAAFTCSPTSGDEDLTTTCTSTSTVIALERTTRMKPTTSSYRSCFPRSTFKMSTSRRPSSVSSFSGASRI